MRHNKSPHTPQKLAPQQRLHAARYVKFFFFKKTYLMPPFPPWDEAFCLQGCC